MLKLLGWMLTLCAVAFLTMVLTVVVWHGTFDPAMLVKEPLRLLVVVLLTGLVLIVVGTVWEHAKKRGHF